MKIKLSGSYKSLSNFETDEIAGLCIITGKNGSGKTQFLELFNFNKDTTTSYSFSTEPHLNSSEIQIEGLNSFSIMVVSRQSWISSIEKLTRDIGFDTHILKFIANLRTKHQVLRNLSISNFQSIIEEQPDEIKISLNSKIIGGAHYHSHNSKRQEEIHTIIAEWLVRKKYSLNYYIAVADFLNKEITDLQLNDFFQAALNERYTTDANLFRTQFEELIYTYSRRRNDNHYHWFLKKENGFANNSISDDEFTISQLSPIKLINTIFDRHNIPYFIKEIGLTELLNDQTYQVKFTRKDTLIDIDLHQLSSGEKIIVSLIIKLFLNTYFESDLTFPRLLVLDEPDAYLHPEMSKLLLEVLNESFVKSLGMTVIMTTHSPTTVALAPEESIWEIKNTPYTTLNKILKDHALEILTSNIPTLNINYQSHRQIFVESPSDLEYYQMIYDKIRNNKDTIHQLYFISLGYGQGNCENVTKLVTDFRKAGNKTTYGITDWDLKNITNTDSNIFVHGENNRYSIENYLYDPIYIACLFLKMGDANNFRSELKFGNSYNEYTIGNEKESRLQEIADWVIHKIEKKHHFSASEKERIEVNYYNNKKLNYPIWLLRSNGHSMFEKMVKSFDSFQAYNEKKCTNELSIIAAKCYPFIAKETIDLISQIAN